MSGPLTPVFVCPGEGRLTRGAGVVYGTEPKTPAPPGPTHFDQGPKRIMEWQWAQTAMYAYYFADFMRKHPTNGFVLSEAEYAYLLTGVQAADDFLEVLSQEFRRDYSRAGRLRPDILGFHVGAKAYGYEVAVEILEVTTRAQLASTYKEDVAYKLGKLKQILGSREFDIRRAFSAVRLTFQIGPSKWKPHQAWQRIVPLPLRQDDKGQTLAEWICFQPTFNQNDGQGIDGLLLYEIHSIPLKSQQMPQEALKRVLQKEREERQRQQVAYGLTLTPWLTTQYLDQHFLDRDQMQALAVVCGVGLVAALAYLALPVIAAVELVELAAFAGAIARSAGPRVVLSAGGLVKLGQGLEGTMMTVLQWLAALGRPVATAH